MPWASKHMCGAPGCSKLVAGAAYCDDHTRRDVGSEPKYDRLRGSAASRGYDRHWQTARLEYLRKNPIAVDWFGAHRGRVYPAEVVDHIVPHRGDMELFWDHSNWQGLTARDHDRKTAIEDGGFGRAVKAGRVTLVCGPPGSGKTTYAQEHRAESDIVWDLDAVMAALTGLDPHDRSKGRESVLPFVLGMRDAFYAKARDPVYSNRIWIIESCPTQAERDRFQRQYGARIVLLAVGRDACMERIASRGESWRERVEQWWQAYEADQSMQAGVGGQNP